MNKKKFKIEFKKTLEEMYKIMEKKNADYTRSDPFGNFKLVESLGITTVEKGILVRMADKMSRISTLIDQQAQVKDEAIEDTLQDLANYAIILKLYLDSTKTIIGMDKGEPGGDKTAFFTAEEKDGEVKISNIEYINEKAATDVISFNINNADKFINAADTARNYFISDRTLQDYEYDNQKFESFVDFLQYIEKKF